MFLFRIIVFIVIFVMMTCLPKYCDSSPLPDGIEHINNQKVNETTSTQTSPSSPIIDIISSASHDSVVSISPSSEASSTPDPRAVFNDRRRDMFFENYTLKQIEIIDTTKVNLTQFIADREKKKADEIASQNLSKNCITIQTENGKNKSIETKRPDIATNIVRIEQTTNFLNNDGNNPNTSFLLPASQEFDENANLHNFRQHILIPKLDFGKPSCIESPDDTFCEVVDNYPKNIIRDEIGISPNQYIDLFGSKEIDGRKSYVDEHEADEESVCRKVPRVIYPQMAKNQANQWLYVVNEVEYTQAVVVDICERPGKPCAHMDNMPPGMYSRCKQKFSYKRLLALHPTEKKTYPDTFKFPSCCSCYVKFIDDLLPRNSIGRTIEFRPISKVKDNAEVSGSEISLVISRPPLNDISSSDNRSLSFSSSSPSLSSTTISTSLQSLTSASVLATRKTIQASSNSTVN